MDTERLIKDANLMRELLQTITQKIIESKQSELTADFLLAFCTERGTDISMFMAKSENGWWQYTEDEILRQWLAGETSEGHVAYVLNADRIDFRVRAEKFAALHGLKDNRWG